MDKLKFKPNGIFALENGSFVSSSKDIDPAKSKDITSEEDLRLSFSVEIITPKDFQFNVKTESVTLVQARVFYKGMNRNRVFLSSSAVDQIVETLKNSPIVGEFDEDKQDFTGHNERTIPYGFITNDEVEWVDNVDADGVTRTYATFGICLWTNRYPISKQIINKKLSMELDPSTVDGGWKNQDGFVYYNIENVNGFAVAVLGDDVEPCFEGAAFFTNIYKDIAKEFELLKKEFQVFSLKQGGQEMKNNITKEMTFKLSFSDITWKLWEGLNTEEYNYTVTSVYDTYAIVFDYSKEAYFRQHYTVAEEAVTLGELEEVKIIDVTTDEYAKIEAYRASDFKDYSQEVETLGIELVDIKKQFEKIKEDVATKDATIETLNSELETGKTATGEKDTSIAEKNAKIVELESALVVKDEDILKLSEFKLLQEKKAKEALFVKFTKVFSDDDLRPYKEKMDDFTYDEIESQLAVLGVKNKIDFGLLEEVETKTEPEAKTEEDILSFNLEGQDDNFDGMNFMKIVKGYKEKTGQK